MIKKCIVSFPWCNKIDEIGCDMKRGFIAIFIKLVGRKTEKLPLKWEALRLFGTL